ncbi:MAG: hypothetical protein CL946_03805 [Ectothiorhodospiraceae bacterium]|nr:hypothetical protein [Ectothiorhodospiraceae bacterium]
MRYSIIIIALIPLLVGGCSDEDSPSSPGPQIDLMPLEVGNYWVHKRTPYLNGEQGTVRYDTMRILGTFTSADNQTWYASNEGGSNTLTAYRNSELGLVVMNSMGSFRLPYPTEVGESLTFEGVEETMYISVLRIDTVVTTLTGDYTCINYALGDGTNLWRTVSVMPGVGIVYVEEEEQPDQTWFTSELIAYELK